MKGLTWAMGDTGRVALVLAVADRFLVAMLGTKWARGTYASAQAADTAAAEITEGSEEKGWQLIAGPLEFDLPEEYSSLTTKRGVAAVCDALGMPSLAWLGWLGREPSP